MGGGAVLRFDNPAIQVCRLDARMKYTQQHAIEGVVLGYGIVILVAAISAFAADLILFWLTHQ
jgi:hypothetical protein